METIAMSVKERRRMTLMTRVTGRVLKLSVAAEMMRVSYRQAKRILSPCGLKSPRGGRMKIPHLVVNVATNLPFCKRDL